MGWLTNLSPVFLLLVALLSSADVEVLAQERQRISPGQKARIMTTSGDSITGIFTALHGDSVLIRASGSDREQIVPRGLITTLEVSRGRRARALFGAGVGFLIGAIGGGGVMYVLCANTDDCPRMIVPAAYGAGIGAVGAALGAFMGAIERRELWERVSPEAISRRPPL